MVYVSGALGQPLKGRSFSSIVNSSRRTDGSRYLFRGRVYRRLYKLPQYTGEGEECLCCTLEDGCCGAVASLLCVLYILVLIFSVQKSTTVKKTAQPQKESDTDFGTPVYVSRSLNHTQSSFQNNAVSESGHCQPKQNFVFIRHNASANAIITNILQRFGDAQNLNFAVPECVHNRVECHSQLQWNLRRKFNIICDSVRFSKRLLQFMPVDSIYFTMIRDPTKQPSRPNCSHPLISENTDHFCCEHKHVVNEMIYNLGLDDSNSTETAISALPHLKSLFDFVLIEEYFEESLLLLKKEMCWSFSDILYFIPQVKHYQDYGGYFSQNCNKVGISGVQNKSLDILLYHYFNASFWRRLEHYGDNIKKDLVTLRFYVQLLSDACNNRFLQKVERVPYNVSEVITKPSLDDCLKMVKSNTEYSKYLSLKNNHLIKRKKKKRKDIKE